MLLHLPQIKWGSSAQRSSTLLKAGKEIGVKSRGWKVTGVKGLNPRNKIQMEGANALEKCGGLGW